MVSLSDPLQGGVFVFRLKVIGESPESYAVFCKSCSITPAPMSKVVIKALSDSIRCLWMMAQKDPPSPIFPISP